MKAPPEITLLGTSIRPQKELDLNQQIRTSLNSEADSQLIGAHHNLYFADTIDAHHIHEAITMEKGLEMPSHFAAGNETQQLQNTPDPAQTSTPLKHNEHMYISQLLERFNHDKQAVAAELGISVRTLYRKLKQRP